MTIKTHDCESNSPRDDSPRQVRQKLVKGAATNPPFLTSTPPTPHSHALGAQEDFAMSASIPSVTIYNDKNRNNPADLDVHASLTTGNSEDWAVVPDGSRVLVLVMRQQASAGAELVHTRSGWASRSEFLRRLRGLPAGHDLGVVSVHVTTDAEASRTTSLLAGLSKIAEVHAFNLLKIVLPDADTKQCIRNITRATGTLQ